MKVAAAAFFALVVGLVAGILIQRSRTEAEVEGVKPPVADSAAGAVDTKAIEERAAEADKRALKAEADLAAAQKQMRDMKKKDDGEEKAGKKKTPKTPEEIAARVAEMKDEIEKAVATKDGKKLVALMKEAAKLGEAGYMTAIEISGILSMDVESGKPTLGLTQNEFYMSFGQEMVPVMVWGLQKGEDVPAGFRIGAAYSLPWQTSVDGGKIMLEALLLEKNPDVAAALAAQLGQVAKPGMVADLAKVAAANADNPKVMSGLIATLGAIDSPEVASLLDGMLSNPNEAVRAEAEIALIAYRPAAPGVLITYTAPNSQAEIAGIIRGDIITSYNGVSISSMDQLKDEIGKTSGDGLVSVSVNRKGEVVTLQIKGQKIGIGGKSVAPK